MSNNNLNWIVNFIWGIADAVREPGGVEAFFNREVLPHVPDARIEATATKIGYEISFTRYFYKPQALRTLAEIRADIEALEQETEGLLGQILVETENEDETAK